MIIYVANLIFVFIMSYLSIKCSKIKIREEIRTKVPNMVFISIMLIPMILIGGLRYEVGTDFYNYSLMYYNYAGSNFMEILMGGDPGFALINWISAQIVYSPQLMFFITTVITTTLMVMGIRKYSNQFEISMFLYITTMAYYAQFNIVRQCIAVAIIFYNLRYIKEGNLKKYICIVLIASTMHSSALVLIPVYFIVRWKSWSFKIWGIVLGIFTATMFFNTFTEILFSILQGSKYQKYTNILMSDDGVNVIRIIVASIPVIIAGIFYKQLKRNNKDIDILINYSLINMLILIISMKATYFGRIGAYFSVYNILLIPEFIKMEKSKYKYLIYVLIVLCYTAYMMALLPVDADLLPYTSIFSSRY